MGDSLDARIGDLEREAASLRTDILRTPVFAQEEAGTWTRFQRFGRTGLELFREAARRADSERAARIEAAYQRVHDAIQAVAALALCEFGAVPVQKRPADAIDHRLPVS